jgi:hypothetical protein
VRQIAAVHSNATTPSAAHASTEPALQCISATQIRPATTIPLPTPANTIPLNRGRPVADRRSRDHEDVKTSTQALAMPASARSTIHTANVCDAAMPIVTSTIATRPARIAVAGDTRSRVADNAPSR